MALIRGIAVCVTLLGLTSADAVAQSLASAAQAAEAQRRASPVEPIVVNQPRSVAADSNDLTAGIVDQYVAARMAVADAKRADNQLDLRLFKSLKAAIGGTTDDLIRIYEGEAAIVGALQSYGFTVASFGVVDARIRRGRQYSGTTAGSLRAPAGTQLAADAAFVKAHRARIDDIMQRCFQYERKLMSAGFEETMATQ